MFKNLKLAFKSFKNNWQDYLAISFVFSVIILIGFLIGQLMLGMLFAYVIIMIPAIISLKFCVYQSYNKEKIEYRSLKIGFITFFKSIKIYSIVVLKPILISLLVGTVIYSVFLSMSINIASETIPSIMESLADVSTVEYAYEEMLKIKEVATLLSVGSIVSLVSGYLIYFSLKLKRDFIPFVAFEMPVTSKRAIAMNSRVLKGNYLKFFVSCFIVTLMFLAPLLGAYLTKIALQTNVALSNVTVGLVSLAVFCVLAGPIATFKQLHYIHSYKENSKPFKEDFDNELKNVIKEIEELQKIIDKNNEK